MQEPAFHNNIFENDINLVRASKGQRFANYIIDLLVFYVVVFIIFFIISPYLPATFWAEDTDTGANLTERIIFLVLYALYMSLMESIFKGKSIGKYITNTRAVHLDGSAIGSNKAFSRGFSRAVPFCVFSALGNPCNPWQDRWTDTIVIDEKLSQTGTQQH